MNQKSLSEIVQSIINNIHDTLPDIDTKEGTFIRDVFINPVSDEVAALYGEMKLLEMNQSILTATGTKLDNLAKNYFVYRKPAMKSSGKMRFYINNTNTPFISDATLNKLPIYLSIPKNTVLATLQTVSRDPLEFTTTEEINISRDQIVGSLIDSTNGYRFVEVSAESVLAGSNTNVGMSEIVQIVSGSFPDVAFISNPFAFTGGSDAEDDTSLALRINLAISGANIGTKSGYLGYVLKQNGVIDSTVIGAGDKLMTRDGGYVDSNNAYHYGSGGMVDIYVRGSYNSEDTYIFQVDNNYVNSVDKYSDIILPKQPINNIISITSNAGPNAGKIYINADEFETEKFTTSSSTGSTTVVKYYKDIPWDFSVTDNFPDVMYYPLPSDISPTEIQLLKQQIDTELLNASLYMTNLNYGINWGSVITKDGDAGNTTLFRKLFINNEVYKIEATDYRLGSRVFVKKNDKINLRVYFQPDYELIKDNSNIGGSILGSDKIRWLNGTKPLTDDYLTILYNYDQLVNELQNGIDNRRILTANVLVKQAKKISVEIIFEATCYSTYDPATVKKLVINRIVTYINSVKKLGGSFARSDIVAIARQTEGISSVNIDNVHISIMGSTDINTKVISAADNEYLQIENILLDIYTTSNLIM